MKLSAVIPVYNEATTITQVVERVLEVSLDHTLGDIEKEIIVVDDGSTDETRSVLSALAARWPHQLKVVYHEENQGKGAAIRTALDHVTGDLVITQDADM